MFQICHSVFIQSPSNQGVGKQSAKIIADLGKPVKPNQWVPRFELEWTRSKAFLGRAENLDSHFVRNFTEIILLIRFKKQIILSFIFQQFISIGFGSPSVKILFIFALSLTSVILFMIILPELSFLKYTYSENQKT